MNDFEFKFAKTSLNERKILQILSICYEPITANEFNSLLKELELKTPENRAYSAQYSSLLRNSLLHKSILQQVSTDWGTGYEVAGANLKEFLIREALTESWFDQVADKIRDLFKAETNWSYDGGARYKYRLLRDYRLSIYQQNLTEAAGLFLKIQEKKLQNQATRILLDIFAAPFQKELLARFDDSFQKSLAPLLLNETIENAESTRELWEFVRENNLASAEINGSEAAELILKGEIAAAKKLLDQSQTVAQSFLLGVIAVLEKEDEVASHQFENSIKLWKKLTGKKKGYPDAWQIFFYGLALYKCDEAAFSKFVEDFYAFAKKNEYQTVAAPALRVLQLYLQNNDGAANSLARMIQPKLLTNRLITIILAAVVPSLPVPNFAAEFESKTRFLDYQWAEFETVNLLAKKNRKQRAQVAGTVEKLRQELNFEPVGDLIPPVEDWERAVRILQIVGESLETKPETAAQANETRIAWQLDFDRQEIQPVEQKYAKANWSAGRNIALKRLFERDVKNLTEQDSLAVKKGLKRHRDYGYYISERYDFDWEETITALIAHPHLFLAKNPTLNVQLVASEPALVVREKGKSLEVTFDTDISGAGTLILKETETRYKVYQITRQHLEIANSFKNKKLVVPEKGRSTLVRAIQTLSSRLLIQSDLAEHLENLPSVESENRIHALVTPAGTGFHLEFFVKPFGTIPPYFKPGKGSETVVAEVGGVRTRTSRDLKNERQLLDQIEESTRFLAESESANYEWDLFDAEECLKALSELEVARNAGWLVIEWPQGQKLKLLGNIGFDNFSLSVKGKNTWFELAGEARVNEDLVLSMQELNRLLRQTEGNFIELTDGQFIAITEKLRKHLQSLESVTDEKMRLHNLRSGILEDISDDLENFKADKIWKEHLEKLKTVQKFVPELPATFEAELRPYQIDGYNWLSRLANWGVGACLADDMGLGKTLMALALLVERAERGAALVVAPVSVCRNWVKEARRFAPTLNFQIFGGGDRPAVVERLGKYDVLVTSYSLMQAEEELFTNRNFATIVLDEAQAIKNRNTKRSKTVMNLAGDFRLITTGTPIENHLGELWNLFNFINPGLLGSYEFFAEKFAAPVEKNNDDNARKTLQKLIKPFILRRRKNQVLDDLPAKTEILLTVEMSAEERAFYEALRREALERIESEAGETKDKRFRILAELTRLRLACCHPQLVNENIPLGSSKLNLFGETLEELLENKHKALVFSQFVKHLNIVRKYLDDKNISYQYLDGSTPQHIRQERIDDFQRGQGEVFLISLKAGGTGLNLTAADYVIHLDPWWNPAVEDQATDRAHRFGQQRPVTVYRLITENTVEERILKLHETKRDLADSLLEGADSSGKLSADDLLNLIQNEL